MAPKGTFPHDLKIGQRPESPLLFSGKNNHFTSKHFCGFITFETSPHDLTFVGYEYQADLTKQVEGVYPREESTMYTWNPNDPCFGWKGPCFGGVDLTKIEFIGALGIHRIALVSLGWRVSVTILVTFVPWDVYILFSPGHENLCATGKQPFGSRKRVWNVAEQRRVHVDAPNFLWEVKVTGNKQLVHLYTNNVLVAVGMFLLAKGFTVQMLVCQKDVCKYCPFPRVKALWMICI